MLIQRFQVILTTKLYLGRLSFLLFYFFWVFGRTNHMDWYVVKGTAVKTCFWAICCWWKWYNLRFLNKDKITLVLGNFRGFGIRFLFELISVNSQARVQMPLAFAVKRRKWSLKISRKVFLVVDCHITNQSWKIKSGVFNDWRLIVHFSYFDTYSCSLTLNVLG